MTTKFSTIIAGAALALIPLFSETVTAQSVNVEVGRTKWLGLKTQISGNWITGGNGIVKVWFDKNTNRLMFKGLRAGYTSVTFAGNKVRYIAGATRRDARQNVSFSHVIKVYVTPAKRTTRPRTTTTKRYTPPTKSTKRVPRKTTTARKIMRQGSWRIGAGRVRSVSLSGILNGQITRDYALSVGSKRVAAAQVKNGKLMIKGIRRGSTSVYLRGKVKQGGKYVPYVVQVHVTVN